MNCVISLNASYFLKKIIEQIIDDKSSLEDIFNSEEMRLLISSVEKLDTKNLCMGCEGCLDFAFLNKAFDQYYSRLLDLCNSNAKILKAIFQKYHIIPDTKFETISLFIIICKRINTFDGIISNEKKSEIMKINDLISNINFQLAEMYLYNKIASFHDKILDNMHLIKHRDMDIKQSFIW